MKVVKNILFVIAMVLAVAATLQLALYLIYLIGQGLNYIGIIDEPPLTEFSNFDILKIFQKNYISY